MFSSSQPFFFGGMADPFLTTRLLLRSVDFVHVFLRGASAHVRECPVKVSKMRFFDLLNELLSDEGYR